MAVATSSAQPARPRSGIDRLDPYEPAPRTAPGVIQLAANEAPQGPFPAARAALAGAVDRVHRYPQLDGVLIERLAERHGVATEQVALGNGVDAIIGYLSNAYLESGDEMVTGWPSFPTYVLDARKQAAVTKLAPLRDGALDLDELAERTGPRTRLVWVCTPNNPTGGAIARDALAGFLDAVPEHVLVVVDEAYYEYAAGPDRLDTIAEHVSARPNVCALRTFSKIYGLAALRIGYLVGPAAVARTTGIMRHYYDVSELATVAALASLDDRDELERRRAENVRGRSRLLTGLRAGGFSAYRSDANFVAIEVEDADATAARLLERGIATRSLSGLGEPRLLRVAVGSEPEIDRFLETLGALR
jgi:histidinol-phosphate aminotransferase